MLFYFSLQNVYKIGRRGGFNVFLSFRLKKRNQNARLHSKKGCKFADLFFLNQKPLKQGKSNITIS